MTRPLVLIGTKDGFRALGHDGPGLPPGRRMHAVARHGDAWWALSDHDTVWRHPDNGDGAPVATGSGLNCLLPRDDGLLVGAASATLYRLADGVLTRDAGFDSAPGREEWYTPWGGPPDVRSLAADRDRTTVYANVHVGGVLRCTGGPWEDTMDIDNDVHQVLVDPDTPGRAYAAAAVGLGVTDDAGESWTFDTAGLPNRYSRAVALSATMELMSAADGSSGRRAGVYRRPRGSAEPFERCRTGLPEWFSGNVDTFCLAASGRLVVAGDPDGTVYVSEDEGETWDVGAAGLPGVYCVGVA